MRPLLILVIWLLSSALIGKDAPKWDELLRQEAMRRLPVGARVEVRLSRVPSQAANARKWKITGFSPDQPLGLVNFETEILHGDSWVRGQGSATLRAYMPVVVAAAPLSHGESLDESNTRFEERELSRLIQVGYFISKAAIAGRRVKGSMSVGSVVGNQNTQLPLLITAGETVDLVRKKGSLLLTAKVRALQGGLRDQWVQVQNPSSGRLFLARVSGPGEVEIR